MKTSVLALAASTLLMGAEASAIHKRNAHANAHLHLDKRDYGYPVSSAEAETCKIVTYTTWVEVKQTHTPAPYKHTETVQSTVYVAPPPPTTTSYVPLSTAPVTYSYPVPTPDVTSCPTPGTYTFPAKTITLTDIVTVCGASTTVVPPGTHTYGYTTTAVESITTVTVPYVTTYTSANTVYTTLTDTVIVCPSAGTYTAGGYTTTVTKTKTITYAAPTVYPPGTYTHPASTVYVTDTKTVFTCPYTSYVTPAPSPIPSPTYVAPPPPVVTPSYVAPPPAYTPPATPSKVHTPGPKPKPTGSHGGPVGSGTKWGITYTQYNDDKSCKSGSQIYSDIGEIKQKGFRAIRVYAPDCDALPDITTACEAHGIKIIIGVFIRGGDLTDAYSQIGDLVTWSKWHLVELVVIGNESVFGGIISSSALAGLIADAKAKFTAAGYTGKVTTSEVVSTLENNKGLCDVIDIVGVNIQSYFNGGASGDAGAFLQSQLKQASNACGGKPAVCLEAGWPSYGEPINNAHATSDDQKKAIYSILSLDVGFIVYNDYTNAGWKDAAMNGGIEPYFGCGSLF